MIPPTARWEGFLIEIARCPGFPFKIEALNVRHSMKPSPLREKSKRPTPPGGFTLAEMLVTIAILGILATIAVSGISAFLEHSERTKNMRNAQAFVTAFNSARNAGAKFPEETVEALYSTLVSGTHGDGLLKNTAFVISGILPEEVTSLKSFVSFTPPSQPGANDAFLAVKVPVD
jgi:prepilin-type N-terminal cleavage/methylation domain-containing protein